MLGFPHKKPFCLRDSLFDIQKRFHLVNNDTVQSWRMPLLWLLVAISAACYLAILRFSRAFDVGTSGLPGTDRPILLMLGLFFVAFLGYWLALWVVVKLPGTGRLGLWIFGTSLLFRLILLPSTPIQEIDIYRYLWDGAAGAAEVSPFRFAPQEVLDAATINADGEQIVDPQLARLARLVNTNRTLKTILGHVHYGQFTTVYPPVSQAVFRAVASLIPEQASIMTWLLAMKSVLVLFDLATLGLVLWLLKLTGRPIGWGLAYGWCPLVMKEFANSGHLDSIALFFTTLAMVLALLGMQPPKKHTPSKPWLFAATAAIVLALAISAKLYPVILGPLLAIGCWRRLGSRFTVGISILFLAATWFCLAPMFATHEWQASSETLETFETSESLPPFPSPALSEPPASESPVTHATAGLWEFLKRWEMNDLIFMLVVENLRPQSEVAQEQRPWFVFLPESWSQGILRCWSQGIAHLGKRFGEDLYLSSFLLARTLTGLVFLILAIGFAWRATRPEASARNFLEAGFLTIAWFWLLAPTQNPWYWCWALPLIPFVQARAWLGMAALTMLYYLRFWLEYHLPEPGVLGTAYAGAYFFHYVVVFVEFLPWFVLLAVETVWRYNRRRSRS